MSKKNVECPAILDRIILEKTYADGSKRYSATVVMEGRWFFGLLKCREEWFVDCIDSTKFFLTRWPDSTYWFYSKLDAINALVLAIERWQRKYMRNRIVSIKRV